MTPAASLPREVPYTKRAQPVVDAALKEKARECLLRWVKIAEQRFGRKFYVPTVSFDLIGKVAGRAYWRSRHIRFNHILLLENFEQFEQSIIPHELSHLICRFFHGKEVSPHGDEWKAVMRKLGVEPDRTHSLDTTNSRTSPLVFGYVCSCNPNNSLTSRQHKRASAGTTYTCRKCKGAMEFTAPPAQA